ncbi:MAG: glycosyltransferase [Planctomycetes bacterium]|nr:glycosyltransferase [Planctomycetota bacterium]
MRLLYVVHQFFPDCHSGTEQYCLAVARAAQRHGDEVTVLSLHPCHEDEMPPVRLFDQPYDGVPVVRLNHWRRMNPNDVLRDYENRHLDGWFQAVLDEVRPDAVHFFHLRQLGSNLIAVARRSGARTVVNLMDFWYLCPRFTLLRRDGTLCGGPPDGGRGCVACEYPELADHAPATSSADDSPAARLRALLDRPSRQLENLAGADAIIAPSRFLAGVFADNGLPRDRMTVVPYGLAPDRIVPIPATRPRAPLRLAFCGVLSPWKAPHLAVEAVLGTDAAIELTVHGRTAEPMFQDYIDRTMARAADDPRIRFAGAYAAADTPRVFAEMDLLIVPSTWYENTPFVVLEAFAAGVPVLASALGGLREVIRHDENGALFPAGDIDALRRAIERIAAEPSWFGHLRMKPPAGIADNYDVFRAAYRPTGADRS